MHVQLRSGTMGSRPAPHRRRVERTLAVGAALGVFALACGANSSGLFDEANSSSSCDTAACADDSGDLPARARRDPSPRPPPADPAEGASDATFSGDDTTIPPATSPVASSGSTPTPEPPPSFDCPSYEEQFFPLIHTPVCSGCHRAQGGLPDWASYGTARAACAEIAERVLAGDMPPSDSGLSLEADERRLVSRWAELDCPQTPAQAAARCAAGADAGAAQPVPPGEDPPPTLLTIERARWDADDEVLEIRGDVSSSAVTLTAEFFSRSEPLANEGGSFRAEFSGVVANPGTVSVTASDGATATAPVEED